MRLVMFLYLTIFSVIVGCASANENVGLNVDCKELDRLLDITERASKFDRVDGEYRLDAELMDLSEYGVSVLIPKPVYNNVIQLPPPSTGLRFMPEDLSLDSPEEIGVTVLYSEIIYGSRNHLRKMMSDADYVAYRDIGVFDFLVMSLGKEKNGFQCGNQGDAVAMFVASNLAPLGNSMTYVYYLSEIDALLLVPKDEQVNILKLVYPKSDDELIYIFIGGEKKAKKAIIDSITKIQ